MHSHERLLVIHVTVHSYRTSGAFIVLENVGVSEQNRSVAMFKVTTSGPPACTQPPTFSRRRHMPVAY